tara:strand:+ start:1823 stop:2569 length:747 start_codon:yes stop_codon:yes gene_type:complete
MVLSKIKEVWRETRQAILPFRVDQQYAAYKKYVYYQSIRQGNKGLRSFSPFDEKKCIFIHIPKNGGMSVAKGIFGDQLLGGHYCAEFFKIVYKDCFDTYFKFAVARNPWDRLVSAYEFLKSGGMFEGDRRWAEKHLSGCSSFHDFVVHWVTPLNIYKGLHFIPQHEFVCSKRGKLLIDYVGKLEQVNETYAHIRNKLGLPEEAAPLVNRSRRQRDYRGYYTDATAAKVAEIYSDDIELFGYTFDGEYS